MIKTKGGHFWITFDNGYTLSCFNGYGSYTENYFKNKRQTQILDHEIEDEWESNKIEIAILKNNNLVTQDIIKEAENNVMNVMTVDTNKLVEIINIVNNLKE